MLILYYYQSILAQQKGPGEWKEFHMPNSKFKLVSALGEAYDYVDMQCMINDHSACKTMNIVAVELARHASIIAGFDRAKSARGEILPGTIVRIKFRSGVSFEKKSKFVTNFVKTMNELPGELFQHELVDFNEVLQSGAQSLMRG